MADSVTATTSDPFYATFTNFPTPTIAWPLVEYNWETYYGQVSCYDSCPGLPMKLEDTEDYFDEEALTWSSMSDSCLSAALTSSLTIYEDIFSQSTEGPEASSIMSAAVTRLNNMYFTYASCLCENSALQPYKTGTSGVCDSGSATACAPDVFTSTFLIEYAAEAYSDMCSSVTANAAQVTDVEDDETTATGTGAGATTGSGTGDADGAEETGSSEGAAVKGSAISLTGALLVGMLGACLLL